MSDIEQNLIKLQQIFEGVDSEANAHFTGRARELKLARIKQKLRENVSAQMIINAIHDRLKNCNQILTRDRGMDRDPVMDKIYRVRVFERQDTLEWVLSLFGGDDEITEIEKDVVANLNKQKEDGFAE